MVYFKLRNLLAARRLTGYRNTVKRGLTLGAVACLSFSVTGCSLAEQFGPSPNKALSSLYQEARTDADYFSTANPGLAALRSDQAAELHAEIVRTCGLREDGTVAPTCDDAAISDQAAQSPTTLELRDGPSATYASTVLAAPEASRPLLVAQTVDYAVQDGLVAPLSAAEGILADPELNAVLTQDSEQQILAEVARFEAGTVYALETAQAFVGDDAIAETLDQARDRLSAVNELLAEPVVPAATYEVVGEAPTDEESGWSLVHRVLAETEKAWAQAATTTQSPELLLFYVTGAASARG